MKLLRLFSLLTALLLSATNSYAELAPETLVGKIAVAKGGTIDAKAHKELALIAQKIKKLRKSGSVRIVGTPTATSQEDFITKSVFVARNTETQLRKLLPQSFQIYVTADKFVTSSSSARTEVAVYLYPHELRPEGAKFISTDIDQAQALSAPEAVQQNIEKTLPGKAAVAPEGGLLSQPQYDEDYQANKSSNKRIQVETEDAAKAEELVSKAKARAAKKAKQLESE